MKRARRCFSYAWPGNIRELRNVVERASILCAEEQVQVSHLGLSLNSELHSPHAGADMSLEALEKAAYQRGAGQ